LTSEQLQTTRAQRWRHAANPILTADDAREWIDGIGLCLFSPRRAHFATPGPSFVEAVAGVPSDAPAREAVENASTLLHRLTAEGAVVPLNLLGATGASIATGGSDQPDFLVSRAALPYIFSLIGGRNWKTSPGGKVSPLMVEVWTLLNGEGALTAQEIQTALGRELTEAAILRALVELWNGLRVIPVYDGEVTRWELTQARFAAEMTASQKVAQATALSALVSLYLGGTVAASTEEIEVFLSPLTARSRVREVVNGLQATQQLSIVSVAAQPLLHVAGSLPEFPDAEPLEVVLRSREPGAEGFVRKTREGGVERKPYGGERKPYERGARSGERGGFDRGRSGPPRREGTGGSRERTGPPRERTGPPRERSGFGRPSAGRFAAAGEGSSRPSRPGATGERPYRKPDDRKPFDGERKSFGKRPFDKSARPSGSRPAFGSRAASGSRPFDRERSGTYKPRPSASADRPRPSVDAGGGERPAKKFGGARPWQDRGAGDSAKRPFRPRREEGSGGARGAGAAGSEKRFGGPKKFGAAKKFGGPKFGGQKSGGRSSSGSRPDSRSSGPRPAGARPSGRRSFGSAESRSSGSRGGFSGGFKKEGASEKRPFFRERPAKAGDGESRPRTFRSDTGAGAAKKPGAWKPKPSGSGFSKTGKPAFKSGGKPAYKSGGKPAFKSGGKPGFKKAGSGTSAKPFAKFMKPSGKGGKPAFGKGKPGGFKAPFRKKKDEGAE
jgi:hypothetical protein